MIANVETHQFVFHLLQNKNFCSLDMIFQSRVCIAYLKLNDLPCIDHPPSKCSVSLHSFPLQNTFQWKQINSIDLECFQIELNISLEHFTLVYQLFISMRYRSVNDRILVTNMDVWRCHVILLLSKNSDHCCHIK